MSKSNKSSKSAKSSKPSKINERVVPAGEHVHTEAELAAQTAGQVVARAMAESDGRMTEARAEAFVAKNGVDALNALTEAQFAEAVSEFLAEEPAPESTPEETAPESTESADPKAEAERLVEAEEAGTLTGKARAEAWAKLAKTLGPVHIRAVRVRRSVTRTAALEAQIKAWLDSSKDEAASSGLAKALEAAKAASAQFTALATALEEVPRAWRPKGAAAVPATTAKVTLAEGATVAVTDKAKKHYEGMVGDNGLRGKVLAVIGKKVKVQTAEGVLFFPKNHIHAVAEEVKTAAE